MLRIKELNLTCVINDSERITEKLGQCLLRLYGQIMTNFKTSLNNFRQVWTSLDKSRQVWKVSTSLDKSEQVWTSLDKPGQVWTSLN